MLNTNTSTTLKNSHVWDVVSQIPLTKKGTFLTAKLSPLNRHRLISVEVHRVLPSFENVSETKTSEQSSNSDVNGVMKEAETCYIRVFQPKSLFSKHKDTKHLGVVPVLGDISVITGTEENDDGSSACADAFKDTSSMNGLDPDRFDGWVAKYRLPIRMVDIVEHHKRAVEMRGESKGHEFRREFVFNTEAAASEFVNFVKQNQMLLKKRAQDRLEYMLSGINLQKDEKLTFLVDICSAMDLPRTDVGRKCDPYVTVRFNGVKIHKTHYISHEDNPIWTLRSKSLFIWKVDAKELFQAEDGLIFEVKDYDAVGENESMGAFSVSPQTMYRWNGERMIFPLKPLLGKHNFRQGSVALRVRRATQHDIEFLEHFKHSKKLRPEQYYFSNLKGGSGALTSLTTRYKKKEKEGPEKNKIKYLTRPSPDPKRKDTTTWLTKEKIEEETMNASYNWIDVGSGNLGKVFVEILSCDNLPNMDIGGIVGNKTDSFVSVVYEDCFARTDVINDCLSPRWLPWSQRSFIFNMMHTSSQLFLGVFDYDSNPLSDHDFIGRVSVDLSNFRPDTVYVLKYKLYPTAKTKFHREKFEKKFEKNLSKHCTITIRLRMELQNERTLLLSNFKYPETVYINVENKKDFRVLNQTIIGRPDLRRYGLANINTYVEELLDLLTLYYFLEDGAISLFLWRSSSVIPFLLPDFRTFTLQWISVGLPLHSLMAFVCAVSLVENLQLIPSFSMGCIAWLLFATMELRSNSPNPWKRSKPLSKMVCSLIIGRNILEPQTIEPDENLDAIKQHDSKWELRLKDAEKKAAERALEYATQQVEYVKQMDLIGLDTDISTKIGGFSIDPTKAWLLPIQEWLGYICEAVRVIKNIIVWEECYITFWIALGSFILSIMSYFMPWAFLIKWTLRILVWVLFGPWMKALDMYYFVPETDEQKVERENRLKVQRDKWLQAQKLDLQLKKERATKLKDFKQHQFGQYVCHVNILKKDRFFDYPLPASSATPFQPTPSSLGSLAMEEAGYHRQRVNGQHLVGDMIPKLMDCATMFTEAPVGKPARKPEQLREDSLGAVYTSDDSYSSAAFKVGSIVLGAGFITWFGVPLLVYALKLCIHSG